jgi:diguanylate cyclase
VNIVAEKNKNNLQADSKVQMRQIIFMLSVGALYSFLLSFFYFTGVTRLSGSEISFILMGVWSVNLALLLAYQNGLTLRFRDPVLTVPMMLVMASGILLASYFLNELRLSMLMLLFAVLILGAFNVRFRYFLLLTLFIIGGYAFVLFQMLTQFSEQVDATIEVIEFLLFVMVTLGILVTVTRIRKLQLGLAGQGERLAEALERVHELSIRDELTGLYNRRKIMELLREEANLAKGGDYHFVVCYLDLDNFKSVNDTFGHGVGDEVIQRFAKVMIKTLRAVDYAGRIGGEEFLVILTNTKMDECLLVAERIRENMQAEKFEQITDRPAVTVSIGAAQFDPSDSLEYLLSRADGALYKAKEEGRNRVVKA